MRTVRQTAALCLAAGLLVAGCSGVPDAGQVGAPAPERPRAGASTIGAAATTTPAAELRAGLTWQLVERTYLLEHARQVLDRTGSRSAPAVRAAEQLIQERGNDLARTVGGGRTGLADVLDAEVDVVLSPVLDRAALTRSHARTAAALGELAPTLGVDALARALDRSTATLSAAVPAPAVAVPAGTAGPVVVTSVAPRAGVGIDAAAAAVAAGLVANAVSARDGLGSTETPAVVLRADLTRLLVGRAHLAGQPVTRPPLEALSETLARRLVAGPGQSAVHTALRSGLTALHAGAVATAAGDDDRARRARAAVAAADRDLATRLAAAVPELPLSLVLRELDPGRGPLVAAAGARANGTDDAPSLAAAAARTALVTAAVLSAGLAEQQRLR